MSAYTELGHAKRVDPAEYELPHEAKYMLKRFIRALTNVQPDGPTNLQKFAADWFVSEYLDTESHKDSELREFRSVVTLQHINEVILKLELVSNRDDLFIPKKPLLDVCEIVGLNRNVIRSIFDILKLSRPSTGDVYIVEVVTIMMILINTSLDTILDTFFRTLGQPSGPSMKISRRVLGDILNVCEGYGMQILPAADITMIRQLRSRIKTVPATTPSVEFSAIAAWMRR
ncbi:hypothetical protein J8273_7730 [Carpediemonas membranifera]|uniref:Uncharacterized protein n=1 Tax=Carpediemonas membranifera TaxID=201153 RepID=A0A8J6ARI4_9EUKA|nr:hypothetical protein J8273_7730 [Carpediemonas membranifera]|eukprot:KAG9390380.1 hypothetical protein J8273_7730 [Carpediemonas membranifera]